MKLKIAAIFSPPAVKYMEELLPELNPYCDMTLLEASGMREARALFEERGRSFDAVVFSGRIYMAFATRNNYSSDLPCYAFDEFVYDLTPILYNLVLNDRDFDFSRVSVDFMDIWDSTGCRKLFPADQMPFCMDEGFIPFLSVDEINAYALTQKVLNWHLELYRAGKTRLAITCHGAITRQLEEADVPYMYIAPSREYVVNFFMQIISSLTMRLAEDQLLGVVALRCNSEDEKAGLIARCSEAIATFARANGFDFSFAREVGKLEFITWFRELSQITQEFRTAPFEDLLGPETQGRYRIGIGTGNTLFQAKMNAANAVSISGATGRIYYVSYDGKVSGPLGKTQTRYELLPDEQLIELSKKYGVDHLSLQQMLAFSHMAGKSVVTAQELAQFMDVSRRTANRLLTKLVGAGGAEIYAENAQGSKGRPRNQYHLLFV